MTGMQVYWMTTPSFSTVPLKPLFSTLSPKHIYIPTSEWNTECIPTLADNHILALDALWWPFSKRANCTNSDLAKVMHELNMAISQVTHRVTTSALYPSNKKSEMLVHFSCVSAPTVKNAGDHTDENWAALPRLHKDGYRRVCWTQYMAKVIAICPSLPFLVLLNLLRNFFPILTNQCSASLGVYNRQRNSGRTCIFRACTWEREEKYCAVNPKQ